LDKIAAAEIVVRCAWNERVNAVTLSA